MKKLLMLFSLILMCTFVFGQTNYALVKQTGNWNTATVSQVSMSPAVARINSLDFFQTGNNNALYATQTAWTQNFSDGVQSGDNNFADVDQKSPDNNSTLLQSGNSNIMKLDQGTLGGYPVADNYAVATQSGNYNKYYMNQDGQKNVQYLTQSGKFNKAWLDQTSKDPAKLNWSEIKQSGDKNWADLDQLGMDVGGKAYSDVYQTGDDNDVMVAQVGEYYDNDSYLLQKGNKNDAFIYQKTWYNNTSTNYETGNHNTLDLRQNSWGAGSATDPWWF